MRTCDTAAIKSGYHPVVAAPGDLLRLHADDDPAVALRDLHVGDVADESGTARGEIPRGRKVATRDIPIGAPVRKYGQVIGFAWRVDVTLLASPPAGLRRIYDAVVDIASGRHTASEEFGFGDEEFTPWQLGAVM